MLVLAGDQCHELASVVRWGVESPVRGVVNVDVTVGEGTVGAPLHFRVGDWSKPPLDVSIGLDGVICAVQIVLQDEVVPPIDALEVSDAPAAGACFDVSEWPPDRYRDERSVVTLGRAPDGLLVVSLGNDRAGHHRLVGEGLVLGFADGQLVELLVGPLAAADWETIDATAAP